ncbi:MAG: hypothetical protein EPGJADBJ_04284 [Saprospiraceae bacterium]|nr:hypothetical protein [Saprospiraceae bacterium]
MTFNDPLSMQSISEVITRLEQIVEWAKEQQSPLGYFAAVYLKMTLAVRDGIEKGLFENGSRMEQLDVRFAGRYFEAFDAWQAGQPCTQSWKTAFEAAKQGNLTVLQHILLGINAHINLDLGIAAAQTRSGDAILGLRRDFDRINDIIAALTDRVQERLADIWLPFGLFDYLLRTEDEGWVHFSIRVARGAAWKAAAALAFARQSETEKALIRDLDHAVALFASKISAPGFWINIGLRSMRRGEKGSAREKIETLLKI